MILKNLKAYGKNPYIEFVEVMIQSETDTETTQIRHRASQERFLINFQVILIFETNEQEASGALAQRGQILDAGFQSHITY